VVVACGSGNTAAISGTPSLVAAAQWFWVGGLALRGPAADVFPPLQHFFLAGRQQAIRNKQNCRSGKHRPQARAGPSRQPSVSGQRHSSLVVPKGGGRKTAHMPLSVDTEETAERTTPSHQPVCHRRHQSRLLATSCSEPRGWKTKRIGRSTSLANSSNAGKTSQWSPSVVDGDEAAYQKANSVGRRR